MGNCLKFSSTIENASGSSKSSLSSSIPTSRTFSTVSTFSAPSYKDSRNLDCIDVASTPKTEGEILSSSNVKAFTYNELKITTRNFRPDGLLGGGGFGHVYKGWIDEYTLSPSKPGLGMKVAIKKLKPEGFQGHKEWLTEVKYLGQLSHPNLVKLIGYCLDDDHRLLVYEYMPKGSLENHLFRRSSEPLTWSVRMNIAVGAARGFAFLHDRESQIIYRDVKASNILLDSDFNTKLSDFGLAKAGPTGDNTHVSTQVMGTFGYAAPEYLETGHLTAKADVYSFGVVLLELLTGRRAVDRNRVGSEQNLVTWAKPFLANKRKVYRIMDPRLANQYPKKAAYAISILILQCICKEAKLRPKMSDVLATLESVQNDEESTKYMQSCKEKNSIKHASLPRQSSSDRKSSLL